MRLLGLVLALAVFTGAGAHGRGQPLEVPLLVSVVYRGSPAGTPTPDDLAAIRALGFSAVTWPGADEASLVALHRLAAPLDLSVAAKPAVTIKVTPAAMPDLQATVWRAVARGARSVAFDAGHKAGTGLTNGRGERLPWARTASEFATRVAASAGLFAIIRPGPAVKINAPAPTGLEIALMDGRRAWLLIATNLGPTPARGVAQLPKGVPYALWLSLLDGTMLSMLHQPQAGPRWTFTIGPGEAKVYVIDKNPKLEHW